ncbi:hypothetical protein [Massilia sp. IC2-476]|uniref:hypothetical protein n=1 Tax=Massilia sp. IC2-476 TaxID=2887199 RepID=UPI001D12E46E|nr:hypothetical protein [Massilia sp. IC2-476]MCC2970765.1 hypothetical protein [Massilia sp. IC2-476]
MPIEAVIISLDAFVPSEESENVEQLYQYLVPLAALPLAERLPAMPAILNLIERFPDAEFGSPGPLVHELEAMPGYEKLLMGSLQRQPAALTVWMANRILNSELAPNARATWLSILTDVLRHPNTSEATKEVALAFLEYQTA